MSDTRSSVAADKALVRRASEASVAVALLLIASKLYAYWVTDSVAVLSSLMDSALDAAASLLNLLAIHHAQTPADRDHRFGHGKAEPLAGLGQSAFIAGSSVFLVLEAAHRFVTPMPVTNSLVGIIVGGGSIVATLALVAFQRYVMRRTRSLAVSADSLHYQGDLLLNGSVIAALALGYVSPWPYFDPIFGLLIGLFILSSAWSIARQSLHALMDHELPDEDRRAIQDLCRAHPDVTGVHDLRTRAAGQDIFIQLHLELDGTLPLLRAHEIADGVENAIRARFPGAEVIIHQDPKQILEPHARVVL